MVRFGDAEFQDRNGVRVLAFPILDSETRIATFWHVIADHVKADPLGMLEFGKKATIGTVQKSRALGYIERHRSAEWGLRLELLRSGQMPEADFHAYMREDEAFAAWARAQTAAAQ